MSYLVELFLSVTTRKKNYEIPGKTCVPPCGLIATCTRTTFADHQSTERRSGSSGRIRERKPKCPGHLLPNWISQLFLSLSLSLFFSVVLLYCGLSIFLFRASLRRSLPNESIHLSSLHSQYRTRTAVLRDCVQVRASLRVGSTRRSEAAHGIKKSEKVLAKIWVKERGIFWY